MKTFYFKGDMRQEFTDKVDLDVSNVREFIDAMSVLFPTFRKFLIRKSLSGIEYFLTNEKGDKFDSDCSEILLNDNLYTLMPEVVGGGAALGVLGNMGLGALTQFGMGYGMNWLQDKLNPVQETGKEYEIIETNSYMYSSNENKVAQGVPVPVVYGQLRVGSLVINSQVNNYDYNYERAEIYQFPASSPDFSISMRKIQNGNFSFITSNENSSLVNLRNQANMDSNDRISNYNRSDSSKRLFSVGAGAAKKFSSKSGNTSINGDYGSKSGAGGSMKRYGPSVGGATVPGDPSTTVGSSEGARPYLFPNPGQVDYTMRPAGPSSSVGVRKFTVNGSQIERNITFDGTSTSNYIRVGNRGAYHRLESIAIYKSLDILSEGPIAGLANPIDGFDRDIGLTSHPLSDSDITLSAGSASAISVGALKYNVDIQHFEDATKRASSNIGSTSITIIANGDKSYTNVPNGSYDIFANDEPHAPAGNLRIFSSNPVNDSEATIGDIIFSPERTTSFRNNTRTTDSRMVSFNANLFLLNGDGSIEFNTNSSSSIDNNLNSKYLSTENIDGQAEIVARLDTLSADALDLQATFSQGGGYSKTDKEITITPHNGHVALKPTIGRRSSFDNANRATFLDGGLTLDDGGQLNETFLEQYFNSSSNTIPNSSETWEKFGRLQLDSTGNEVINNLNSNFRVKVGTYSFSYEYTRSGFNKFNRDRSGTASGSVYWKFSVKNYVGLATLNVHLVRQDANSGNVEQTIKHGSTGMSYVDQEGGLRTNGGRSVTITINEFSSLNVPERNNLGQVVNTNYHTTFRNSGKLNIGTIICFASNNFGTKVYNAFNSAFGSTNNAVSKNNSNNSTTTKHFRFIPGSGSTRNQSQKVFTDKFFNMHMLDGGKNSLDNLSVVYGGNTNYQRITEGSQEQISGNFGPYNPFLLPRCTCYVIRRSETFSNTFQYSVLPTRFDCFALPNSSGVIRGVLLYGCPDQPVWDSNISAWTDICPQPLTHGGRTVHRPFFHPSVTASSNGGVPNTGPDDAYIWQDIGFVLIADQSNDYQSLKFQINNDGKISSSFTSNSALRQTLHNLHTSFADEVRTSRLTPRTNRAAGLIPDSLVAFNSSNAKTFSIDENFSTVKDPLKNSGSYAKFSVGVETIDLSKSRSSKFLLNGRLKGDQFTTIGGSGVSKRYLATGRPLNNVRIISPGSGYTDAGGRLISGLTITKNIFSEEYQITGIDIEGDQVRQNAGYAPNQYFTLFVVPDHGLANLFGMGPLPSSPNAGTSRFPTSEGVNVYGSTLVNLSAVLEIHTNSEGHVDSVYPIYGGIGFQNNGQIVIPSTEFSTALLTDATYAPYVNIMGRMFGTFSASIAYSIKNTTNRLAWPEIHRPKSPLKIAYKASHVTTAGSLQKFYIKESGSGFNSSQVISNPFSVLSGSPPKIRVTFSGGSLTSAVILRSSEVNGYSAADSNVKLIFSAPPTSTTTTTISNDVENDSFAMYRAIYLNDVPIRDSDQRFNFSRFHTDMRIGHYKNGRNNKTLNNALHINESRIVSSKRSRVIDDEFKVPAHTTFINYPLIGPRNDGEKDFYYSYTIKNPEVTDLSISIKLNQLHYIYEGDEEVVFINLVPILGAILGFFLGKWLISLVARQLAPDPLIGTGFGCGCICIQTFVFGATTPGKPSALPELILAALLFALAIAGGLVAAVVFFMIAKALGCGLAPFLCFKIGGIIKNSGEIWPAKVLFGIEYGVEGEQFNQEHLEIAGCATSPYVKDVYINNLPLAEKLDRNDKVIGGDSFKNRIFKIYRLTRELDPVTGGLVEARYKIDAELLSITEYICGFFSYPSTAIIGTRINSKDMPEIPKREYIIKGRLLKVPSNYAPEAQTESGRYVGSWTGTFNPDLQFTSNPAWIIWDLLTNQKYGSGKYGITEEHLDKWSFYEFAKYCDEEVEVFIEGKRTTERRHMCNLYIDAQRNAHEYIKELLQMYNASMNFTAGKFYFTADTPDKEPLMLFNNSNVSEEGFSYSSTPETQRVTACTVDYVDERDNYYPKSEYVEDVEGIKKHGYLHIRLTATGVTRKGEAHRLGWLKILTRQLEKEIIQFKTGIQASYLKVGDVIDVIDNKKIAKHSGGRVARKVNNNTLELDIPASILSNSTAIKVQVPFESDEYDEDPSNSNNTANRQTEQWIKYTITGRSGFNVTVSPSLNSNITSGSTWIIENNNTDSIRPKQYRIQSIKELSHLNFEITAIDYVMEKYERIQNSTAKSTSADDTDPEYYGPTLSLFDSNSDVSQNDISVETIKWRVSGLPTGHRLAYSVNFQFTDVDYDPNSNTWILSPIFNGQESNIAFLDEKGFGSSITQITANGSTVTLDDNNGIPWISLNASNIWLDASPAKTNIINSIKQTGTHNITLS